jgi:hypothetical protein
MNEYQSVDVLINEIKGNSNFLASLISKKSGLVFLVIVFGIIVSNILMS